MNPIDKLKTLLSRLPGLGEKSGMRVALAIINAGPDFATVLAKAITDTSAIHRCEVCCDLTDELRCSICSDARREPTICVVANPQDRMAFERAAVFRGRYHILHGVLDPLSGVGPFELTLRELLERARSGDVLEIIVATPATVEGDATALYLAHLLRDVDVRVTRIATGVAVGGEIEHADMSTLSRAIEDRRVL
jgi:recombination protein RecR